MKKKEKQYRILAENFRKFLTEEPIQAPRLLYHVARAQDTESIKSQGLIANTGDQTDTDPGRIYFAISYLHATKVYKNLAAKDNTYQNGIAVVVDTTRLAGVNFYNDPSNGGIYTETDIPPTAIAKIITI